MQYQKNDFALMAITDRKNKQRSLTQAFAKLVFSYGKGSRTDTA